MSSICNGYMRIKRRPIRVPRCLVFMGFRGPYLALSVPGSEYLVHISEIPMTNKNHRPSMVAICLRGVSHPGPKRDD